MDIDVSSDPSFPQPRNSRTALEFITFTNPEMAKTAINRQLVKRQAMRNVHSRSGVLRGRRNEIELDITSLLQNPGVARRPIPGDEAQKTDRRTTVPGLTTPLDMSRLDPFCQYLMPIRRREHELYDHLYDGTCFMFRTLRDIGFLNLLRETNAFYQALAMSSWHMSHLNENGSTIEHVRYSLVATRWLQKQINDPITSITDDAIAAVLAFVCCANLIHDSISLRVHIGGLKLLINGREGGINRLDSNYVLRTVLFWADINGAYLQDTAPQFPPPEYLFPQSSTRCAEAFSRSVNDMAAAEAIHNFCLALKRIQETMRAKVSIRNLWNDTTFPGFYLSPILGDLLAVRVPADNQSIAITELEAFRLAAILYISNLRALFGVDTLSGDVAYAIKLKGLMSDWSSMLKARPMMSMWTLSVAATSQRIPQEDRDWFAQMLNTMMATKRVASFDELIAIIDQIAWDEVLLVVETRLLKSFLGGPKYDASYAIWPTTM